MVEPPVGAEPAADRYHRGDQVWAQWGFEPNELWFPARVEKTPRPDEGQERAYLVRCKDGDEEWKTAARMMRRDVFEG